MAGALISLASSVEYNLPYSGVLRFLREDFNIALGTIRNIKIRIVFVNAVICWSCDIFVSSAR